MNGRLFDNDREVANSKFKTIIEAIQSQDGDMLNNLFSKNALNESENFNENAIALIDFFQGEMLSYDDWGGPGVEQVRNENRTGRDWKSIQSTYDVETSEGKYRFAIKEYTMDTADSDNIGIYSLYIIKAEDTDLEFAYWGDGKWTPGINIETNSK